MVYFYIHSCKLSVGKKRPRMSQKEELIDMKRAKIELKSRQHEEKIAILGDITSILNRRLQLEERRHQLNLDED